MKIKKIYADPFISKLNCIHLSVQKNEKLLLLLLYSHRNKSDVEKMKCEREMYKNAHTNRI